MDASDEIEAGGGDARTHLPCCSPWWAILRTGVYTSVSDANAGISGLNNFVGVDNFDRSEYKRTFPNASPDVNFIFASC
jgi:hypothetical protein